MAKATGKENVDVRSLDDKVGRDRSPCPLLRSLSSRRTRGAPTHGTFTEMVKKIKAVYGFKISGGPGGETVTWIVDVKNGTGSVEKNSSSE